jgi:hypothetical protein
MKTIFKVNPYCRQVIELPKLAPHHTHTIRQQRREGMIHMHGVITHGGVQWKDADAITIAREDDTTVTLKL